MAERSDCVGDYTVASGEYQLHATAEPCAQLRSSGLSESISVENCPGSDAPEGRALSARFLLFVVQRRAQDDPAIDRHDFKLKRKPLAVAVEPCGSNAGPVSLVAFVGDMPGEEVRRIGLLSGCSIAACHDDFLSCLVARCTTREGRTAKVRILTCSPEM